MSSNKYGGVFIHSMHSLYNPVVSVVIPVYNTEKYLEECLSSVCSQTYQNLEILVVNDGSKDGSLCIARDWEKKDSRIKVFDKPNGGQASARNLGLDNVTGTFITFIDSDDFYIEKKNLEYCVEELLNNPAYDIVQYPVIKGNRNIDVEEFVTVGVCDLFNRWQLYPRTLTNYVYDKMFRKSVFEKIRFPEGMIFEDRYLFAEIYSRCPCVKSIARGAYFYRTHENQTVRRKKDSFFLDSIIKADTKLLELMPVECVDAYNEVYYRLMLMSGGKLMRYRYSSLRLLRSHSTLGIKFRLLKHNLFGGILGE